MQAEASRWDVSTQDGFLAYYDSTFAAAHRTAARLTGGHRQRAEDIVQDAYLALMRTAQRGDVTEVGTGWIVTSVRHQFIDGIRSNDRETRRLRLVATDHVDEPVEPRTPSQLLAGLSDRERAALVLRYVDGLAVAEVAEQLKTSVRATESLLQRAKRKARRAGGM